MYLKLIYLFYKGWSKMCLNEWSIFLKLVILGIFMVCLEIWIVEIIIFCIGMFVVLL